MQMEEVQLVRGLRARDEAVVSTFLERYRSLLFHCIGHFERDPSGRDDLYQELVLYVLERLDADRFDPQKGSLGTWLYRVAWCRCVDLKRKGQNRRPTYLATGTDGLPDRPDPSPGPDEMAGEAEIGSMVRRAMVNLEKEDQSLLNLRFVQGHTLGEISERLGISHEQCKYRLKRASTALRRVLLNDLSLERLSGSEGQLQKNANT